MVVVLTVALKLVSVVALNVAYLAVLKHVKAMAVKKVVVVALKKEEVVIMEIVMVIALKHVGQEMLVLKLDLQVTLPSVLVEMVQLKAQTCSQRCRWYQVQEHLEEGLHRCCGSSRCWQHHLVQEELELHHRQAKVHSSPKVLETSPDVFFWRSAQGWSCLTSSLRPPPHRR